MKRGLSLHDISERLQQEFAVDPAHAESSVVTLVEELAQQRLVVPIAGNDDRERSEGQGSMITASLSPEWRVLLLACATAHE